MDFSILGCKYWGVPNPRRNPYQNNILKNNVTYFHMDGAEFVSKRHCFALRFEEIFLNFQRTDPASSKIIHFVAPSLPPGPPEIGVVPKVPFFRKRPSLNVFNVWTLNTDTGLTLLL